jgi:hypothetical protein
MHCRKEGEILAKRPVTPAYVIFYILFSPDTWRIVMGVILAVLMVPHIVKPDMTLIARGVVFVMVATIGYAASGLPARGITKMLKRMILEDKQP